MSAELKTNEILPETFEDFALQKAQYLESLEGRKNTLSHSFHRFGPQSYKKGHEYAPDPSDVDPSVDRLKSILTNGIVSHNFARRAGLSFSRNWGDKENESNLSLADEFRTSQQFGYTAFGPRELELGNITQYSILIDCQRKTVKEDPLSLSAYFISHRISPRFFRGLVVDELSFLDEGVEKLEEAKGVMLEVYKDKPELALPIFTQEGQLYWPNGDIWI